MYVRKDSRGLGHGSAVVAAAETAAVARRLTPLYLSTPSKDAFYRRLAWRVVDAAVVDGKPALVMAKY